MAQEIGEAQDKLPVLLLIFNRKDVALHALAAVREYAPERVYVAADGPRVNRPGEAEKCEKTRRAVLDGIDWPCEIHTLLREQNLGCAHAVSSAIDWFFSKEEFGVIVEDDVVLSQDFFRFASEMDRHYRDDERVMCVNAQFLGKGESFDTSYVFSTMGNCWGWATWRRAWQKMDLKMSLFPKTTLLDHIKAFGLIRGSLLYHYYWKHDYNLIASGGGISSWATRWNFNIFANHGMAIVPTANLAVNVGMNGDGGAHYAKDDKDLYAFLQLESLPAQLVHPAEVKADKRIRAVENRDFVRIRLNGLFKKMRKLNFHR